MAQFSARRLTALPGSPEANTIYLINPPGETEYLEVYVTGNTGGAIRRVPNSSDIEAIVNAAVAAMSLLHIVADITERDALELAGNGNAFILVLDATGDETVEIGAALYVFNDASDTISKVSEYESLDVTTSWSNIAGKPTSTPSEIDDAVGNSHTHANKTQLDKVGESGGRFTYDGSIPTIDWTETSW